MSFGGEYMANILIGYNNRALDATMTSNGSWDGTLVLNNIKSERLALVARTSSASRNNTTFVAKFAANYALRAIALLNHNVSTAGRWRARLSTATLDLDYTGTNPRNPGNVTFSGGANGTRVSVYGLIEAATCPRHDFSPVNLASGTASQTLSNVPPGTYVMITSGGGSAVMATGTTVANSGAIATSDNANFVVVTATGDVTLTVLSAATQIHFRESLGLLVEEARTNALVRSGEFNDAAWTAANVTVTSNTVTSPAGATTADTITGVAGTATKFVSQTIALSSQAVTSFFAKAGTHDRLQILYGNDGATYANFNLKTGAATISVGGTAGIEPAGAGWYRIWHERAHTVTIAAFLVLIDSDLSDRADASSSTGTVHVWGAQCEAGELPTSYIPTTSAAVTRTADSVSLTSTAFTATHSATAGTLYAEFTLTATSGTQPILSLDDNTANERMELYSSGTDLKFKVVDGGSTVVDLTIGTIAAAMRYKVAAAWSANDFAACLGGGTVATDTSGTLPTVDRMRAGSNQAGDFMCGHLSRFGRWNARLTNAELQAITTTGPEAIGYDSGWQDALAMTFHGDTPTNWGAQYPLIAATSEAVTARYLTVEIDDTTNAAGYVQIGHLYASGGFQPEHNAEYPGFADGRIDPSDVETSVTGRVYGTKREQRRKVDFSLPVLSPDEADHVDELSAAMGITESVLYVPDPADAAHSQRYSFWGRFAEVNQLEYPFYNNRSTIFRLEQKK